MTDKKNDIEVNIHGKRYVLCGYESDEYLQKVASYINQKYDDFAQQEGYNVLDTDMKNTLMQINITDDYFKAQKQISSLTDTIVQKDNELFDLKHEILTLKSRLDTLQKNNDKLESDYLAEQKKVFKLEAEVETARRNKNHK